MQRVLKIYRDAQSRSPLMLESEMEAWERMNHETLIECSVMITRTCDLDQYYNLVAKLWKPVLRPVSGPLDFLEAHEHFSGRVAKLSRALRFCEAHYRFVHREKFQDAHARAPRFFYEHVCQPNAPFLMKGLTSFLQRFRDTGVFSELKVPLLVLDLLMGFQEPELFRLWHEILLDSVPTMVSDLNPSQLETRLRHERHLTEYLPHSRAVFPFICHRMVCGLLNRVRLRDIITDNRFLILSFLLAHSSNHVWCHLSALLREECDTKGPLAMIHLWDCFVVCSGGDSARKQIPLSVLEDLRDLLKKHLSTLTRDLPGRPREAAILFRDGGVNEEVVEDLARMWWARRGEPQTIPEITSLLRVLEPVDPPRYLVWKRLLTEVSWEEVPSGPFRVRVFCCLDDRFFPAGMWRSGILVGLPPALENARRAWAENYARRYPSRRITWGDWVSTVELTNGLRMCLPHYLVLDWLDQHQGSTSIHNLKKHFKWETPMIFAVVHSLIHHPTPLLRNRGHSDSLTEKTEVELVPTIRPGTTYGLPVVVDKKSQKCGKEIQEKEKLYLLEARIVQIVKRHGPLPQSALDWHLKKSIPTKFSVIMKKKAVDHLIQLDYIEQDSNGSLLYVP